MAHLDFTFELRHNRALLAEMDARVSCDERYRLTFEVLDISISYPATFVEAPQWLVPAMQAQLSQANKDWQHDIQSQADKEAYGYERENALAHRENAA